MNCRFCGNQLSHVFTDLGETPLANSFLSLEMLDKKEINFSLKAMICSKCFLVQVDEFEKPQNIFNDYAYFSSYSTSWLEHVKIFAEKMIKKFNLSDNDQVIEIASNDGYLLKKFKSHKIPVLGIEPAANVAKIAEDSGMKTIVDILGGYQSKRYRVYDKKLDGS